MSVGRATKSGVVTEVWPPVSSGCLESLHPQNAAVKQATAQRSASIRLIDFVIIDPPLANSMRTFMHTFNGKRQCIAIAITCYVAGCPAWQDHGEKHEESSDQAKQTDAFAGFEHRDSSDSFVIFFGLAFV